MRKLIFTAIASISLLQVFSQVGIGTSTPNPNAALDISSTTKALLPPRMTHAQILAIPNPAAGMIAFDISAKTFRFYNGTSWILLAPQAQNVSDPGGAFTSGVQPYGVGSMFPSKLKIGPNKSVYITGRFSGTITIGAFSNTAAGNSSDVFISKYDSLGNILWFKSIGGSGEDRGVGIDVDAAGNVYVCGGFEQTVDFDPGAAITTLQSGGLEDGFYAKYDANGVLGWAHKIGGTSYDHVSAIVTDGTNVFITGDFIGTASFNTASMSSVAGSADVFFARYLASTGLMGASGWVKQIGGTNTESATAIDIHAGGVALAGRFTGTSNFGNSITKTAVGVYDPFFATYNSFGTAPTVTHLAMSGNTQYGVITDLTSDQSGNIYVGGTVVGSMKPNPSNTSTIIASTGNINGFLVKYNNANAYQWGKKIGGGYYDELTSLAVDGTANVYVTGYMSSNDLKILGLSPDGYGVSQPFIMKIASGGSDSWFKLMRNTGPYNSGHAIDVTADGKLLFNAATVVGTYVGFDGIRRTASNYNECHLSRYIE